MVQLFFIKTSRGNFNPINIRTRFFYDSTILTFTLVAVKFYNQTVPEICRKNYTSIGCESEYKSSEKVHIFCSEY